MERFIGMYGQDWRAGLLSEHVDAFIEAGGEVREAASGTGKAWAVIGGKAYPVVCAEIVEVATEDGPMSGRCGHPATAEFGACETHAAVIAQWARQSEAQIIAWERARG